ncbi:MAG: CinA family protein [Nocardioidaceae bacterium]
MSDYAHRLVGLLTERAESLATAESLTGGLLGATITEVPGASAVYFGGVISYATEVKQSLLGVPADLVAGVGVVSAECAAAMADGVRRLLGATWGLSTTGVAGPDEQEGKPVGTVFVAIAGPAPKVQELALEGDRERIRLETVEAVLRLLLDGVES